MKVGQYVNGDKFVVSPVTITGWTPAPVQEDAPNMQTPQFNIHKNGGMENVGYSNLNTGHGFFSSVSTSVAAPYNNAVNVGNNLPLAYGVGEEVSLTMTTFKEDASDKGTPSVSARSILTVVASEPAAGSFRPAPASISKTPTHTESDLIDLSTLPTLAMPGAPSYISASQALRKDQAVEFGNGNYYWMVVPVENAPPNVWKIYGVARNVTSSILVLLSDIPVAQKRDVAITLCQRAIDIKARAERIILNEESDWGGANGSTGLGGVNMGYEKITLLAGGTLLNDAAMLATANLPIFGEDGSSVAITQELIDITGRVQSGDRPVADYLQADLGMPEWSGSNVLRGGVGNRHPYDVYRPANVAARVAASLALCLWPALYANYTGASRDPFMQYADRVMERDFLKDPLDPLNVNKYARTLDGDRAVAGWIINAWDTHRASSTVPIWDWPV